MMNKVRAPFAKSGRLFATVSVVALLAGCAVVPEKLSDDTLMFQGKTDLQLIFADAESGLVTMSLANSIARALKYNLNHRTRIMEEAMALDQTDLDAYDLLPKLTANAGYSDRNSHNISTSVDSVTKQPSDTNPSYSSERAVISGDLTMSWNVLDFGISYFSAKQNADRAMIAAERRRKVMQTLVQEVRFAYWRVVSAQVLKAQVNSTIASAEAALINAELVEKEGLKKPLEALRFQKTLLETIRQLEAINQELSTARIELASLVNLPPGIDIRVEVPNDGVLTPPNWEISLDKMEALAFLNNPDIREQAYQTSIALKETRKAILSLLPGISLTGGKQYSGDELLVNNRWYEWSTKLTWNVLNIAMAPARIKHAETSEKLAEMQRLALRMAVLAQVHVAERQFRNALKQFGRADQISAVDQRISILVTKQQKNDAQSVLNQVSNQAGAITSQLRRYQAFAQLEAAYGRLYATVGLDAVPSHAVSADVADITVAIEQRLAAWHSGELVRQEADRVVAIMAAAEAQSVEALREEAETKSGPQRGGFFNKLGAWFDADLTAPPPQGPSEALPKAVTKAALNPHDNGPQATETKAKTSSFLQDIGSWFGQKTDATSFEAASPSKVGLVQAQDVPAYSTKIVAQGHP
ncbi:MAG: TolC family protein [Magnetovibrio sp.]|nr:TolC family protein [Magnetovibrio sp.]